jgi:hypothetical protein
VIPLLGPEAAQDKNSSSQDFLGDCGCLAAVETKIKEAANPQEKAMLRD